MPLVAQSFPASKADSLAARLRRHTAAEVRFDAGSRALYSSDLSMYRQVPIGVVVPRTAEDVVRTVALCREYEAPILGRGCGTSLAGQCCNVAVVLDFSKYLNRVLEVNRRGKYAWVEPGVIYDQLKAATEKQHLILPPDPATHSYCTLGGMIGNNSCGAHSVMGGRMADNVEELEILTYDGLRMTVGATSERELQSIIDEGGRRGEIYGKLRRLRDRYAERIRERFPNIPRRVSGYNLDELLPEKGFHVARALVGTESTCAIILRAKVRLMHSPPHRALVVIAYPDVFKAGDHACPVRELGPIALEAFHRKLIDNEARKGQPLEGVDLLPDGDTWLFAEFGGETQREATDRAGRALEKIHASDHDQIGVRLIEKPKDQEKIWHIREAGVGASRIPGIEDSWPSWEDAAVPPENVGNYLRDFYKLLDKFGYRVTLFGHFGDGCIHARITFDLKTAEGVRRYREFMYQAAHTVVKQGGSLSGEHGDGQARAELLPIMFGHDLMLAFRDFKAIWDPQWKMNPGKIVDPYPLDTNLRVGPDYKPKPVFTIFQFPDDHANFAEATERCFGVGKCRGLDGGTMCPSFHATREEMHSTRGRARLLFEMLRGEVIEDGWQSEHVKDALDLCLSCKGCKGECPVNVDVATYKAEFLSHYYERHKRPMSATAMGMIFRWAELAQHAPELVNAITHAPLLARAIKQFGGITQRRRMPYFAKRTFKSWFAEGNGRKGRRGAAGRRVILWPDTFNNYFFPHTAQAAVEVLEAAGFEVIVPKQNFCCGRPLYEYGFLEQAKLHAERILAALGDEISAGTPVVFLEPSCASVFRDEVLNLMPGDRDAQRLKEQSFLFADFLDRAGYQPPQLKGRALVHGHCHQKALFGMKSEERLLARAGLDAEILDSGCCGLAGSFGYEADHFEISMKIGERVLLPRVRAAEKSTLIISDGFSCREQIMHGTRRRAMHTAEVLQMALKQAPIRKDRYVEAGWVQEEPAYPVLATALGAGALLVGGLLVLGRSQQK